MTWAVLVVVLVGLTPTPTPSTTKLPREALELQFFCKGVPVPDTAVYGVDFLTPLGVTSVELSAEETKPRLRVTRPTP